MLILYIKGNTFNVLFSNTLLKEFYRLFYHGKNKVPIFNIFSESSTKVFLFVCALFCFCLLSKKHLLMFSSRIIFIFLLFYILYFYYSFIFLLLLIKVHIFWETSIYWCSLVPVPFQFIALNYFIKSLWHCKISCIWILYYHLLIYLWQLFCQLHTVWL